MNLLRHCVRLNATVSMVVEPDVARHGPIRELQPAATVLPGIPRRFPEAIRYCILAVPDRQIEGVARQLGTMEELPANLMVFHCSGSQPSSILSPLGDVGCLVGSVHPMQSFATDALPDGALSGIGCGIEGSDAFWEEGQRFAEMMEWRPLRIAAEKKALYHAANVFAGNFPAVLASLAEMLLRESCSDSTEERLTHLLPMMDTVVDRVVQTDPAQALTGPAARGDHDTIRRHLDALEALEPQFREVYEALTRAAIKLK